MNQRRGTGAVYDEKVDPPTWAISVEIDEADGGPLCCAELCVMLRLCDKNLVRLNGLRLSVGLRVQGVAGFCHLAHMRKDQQAAYHHEVDWGSRYSLGYSC
jgi:hypothetical protein